MKKSAIFVLDSDVFIAAKNAYYAFDICSGFWNGLLQQHQSGKVFSVSRVRGELMSGRKTEDLVQWVQKQVPDSFFLDVDSAGVVAAFAEIMLWAQRHTRYTDGAKAKFATGADGWLVAYARVNGAIVVTNEQPAPDSKSEIKLPDVCAQFAVSAENTFTMLRSLAVKLELRAEKAP
jgi:hypothetical protein